jgi:nucleoside 2-deoxyribosyltransferase
MNLYFACSITGGRQDEAAYRAIVEALSADGHTIPTAHLSQSDIMALEEQIEPKEVFTRDTTWINECQALIAEVSTPSHGVGYEVAYALSLGKPVLCCHREGRRVSKMLTGNTHPHLRVRAYHTLDEVASIARAFLADVSNITPKA